MWITSAGLCTQNIQQRGSMCFAAMNAGEQWGDEERASNHWWYTLSVLDPNSDRGSKSGFCQSTNITIRGNMFVLASITLQSTFSPFLSFSGTPAVLLLFAVRHTVCFSCLAPLFSIKMAHRCWGGMMLKRADPRRGDKRARQREHWFQLTCGSVQDLGLEEYAGVLVCYAGEEQPLRLHGTPGYDDLGRTPSTLLDHWMWQLTPPFNPDYFCIKLHSNGCRIMIFNALRALWVHENESRRAWQVIDQLGVELKVIERNVV